MLFACKSANRCPNFSVVSLCDIVSSCQVWFGSIYFCQSYGRKTLPEDHGVITITWLCQLINMSKCNEWIIYQKFTISRIHKQTWNKKKTANLLHVKWKRTHTNCFLSQNFSKLFIMWFTVCKHMLWQFCLYITLIICVKWFHISSNSFTLHGSSTILVFSYQTLQQNSNAVTFAKVIKYRCDMKTHDSLDIYQKKTQNGDISYYETVKKNAIWNCTFAQHL